MLQSLVFLIENLMTKTRINLIEPSDMLALLGLWVLILFVALATRPLLPIQETRALAVAWEMWNTKEFVVPHLNGTPYSDKPPLLFWLIHIGWFIFGVNEWWARLVAPLFGLGTVALTCQLSRELWPSCKKTITLVPWILVGSWLWMIIGTLTMYDVLVTFFSVMAIIGLWRGTHGSVFGWLWFGLGIGVGVLAKGPVILVFVLPTLVLVPIWLKTKPPGGWARWTRNCIGGLTFAATIALIWALPAARIGGPLYESALLWNQTSGRIIESFAHGRPFWWYVMIAPILLAPWLVWPSFWSALRTNTGLWNDSGFRLVVVWFVSSFIVLSAISGKQPHYLLPLVPAFALGSARLLASAKVVSRWSLAVPAGLVCLVGISILIVTLWPTAFIDSPIWLYDTPTYLPLVIFLAGLGIIVSKNHMSIIVRLMTAQTWAMVVLAHVFVVPEAASFYDVRNASQLLKGWERAGHPLAFVNTYHGQFHFLGRLQNPIEEVDSDKIGVWASENPKGRIISVHELKALNESQAKPIYMAPYRGKILTIWSAKHLTEKPQVFN